MSILKKKNHKYNQQLEDGYKKAQQLLEQAIKNKNPVYVFVEDNEIDHVYGECVGFSTQALRTTKEIINDRFREYGLPL